ncbi:GNAT family N-acetyltransferase [Undibacterium sp. CY18W]|uniref:GNAT family N-acetyltransferase n=1 Tax=Undibacterium hunanense TaxID=2762292 RepID=A0ABR6ZLL6_9BURK|nr:GNAT family N-acetyltransferase [Undibacterium hunanense]MBC3916803.1 GNAT family N-acetyltransferase [Undibacterium hunanense]
MRRLAESQDLAAVHAIYMHADVIPYLGYDPMPMEEFAAMFAGLLASGSFYVYPVDGVIAGFYKVSRFAGRAAHVAQLGTLAVAPSFQGKGIAQAMLAEAMSAMKNEGVRRLELIVESDNLRGLAFYQGLGFETEGRLRQFYKRSDDADYIDDFIMAKFLY